MKPYTNKDRWRHIKHFVDTHPYSESNLEYLKNWLASFINQSMTTENDSSENRSHQRKNPEQVRDEIIERDKRILEGLNHGSKKQHKA